MSEVGKKLSEELAGVDMEDVLAPRGNESEEAKRLVDAIGNALPEALDDKGKPLLERDDKIFWLDVAELLGPEDVQALYHTVLFMTKVGG